jgi:hypothetical protein
LKRFRNDGLCRRRNRLMPRENRQRRTDQWKIRQNQGRPALFVMRPLQGWNAGAAIALHMQQDYLASQRQRCLGNEQFV